MRYFYARVSTQDQNTDNQILEAKNRGIEFEPENIISEKISGRVCASERPLFKAMVEGFKAGDELVVLKLDRLGRDTIDVVATVRKLAAMGVKVRALNLDGTDLTSPMGELIMTVLAAVAQMERDMIAERTREGLSRVKAEGKSLGRPKNYSLILNILALKEGTTLNQKEIAEALEVSTGTVCNILKKEDYEEAAEGYKANPKSGLTDTDSSALLTSEEIQAIQERFNESRGNKPKAKRGAPIQPKNWAMIAKVFELNLGTALSTNEIAESLGISKALVLSILRKESYTEALEKVNEQSI